MKQITVALCVDDKGGMTFLGRRQSSDRNLIDDLVRYCKGDIYVNSFSEPLFIGQDERVKVVDNPLEDAPSGSVCFIENLPLAGHSESIEAIILYKWNRVYPSDKKVDIAFSDYRVTEFSQVRGSSHDVITRVILKRK